MEPNETPMGPEELRPEPQKSKKKVLPYVVCCLATAVVVFALTFVGMTLLQSRQKSTSDDDYLAKVQEVVTLLDARYVDGLDHTKLGDELAAAAVSATGDRWSYYISAGELAAYQEQNANAYGRHWRDHSPGKRGRCRIHRCLRHTGRPLPRQPGCRSAICSLP